MYAQITKPQAQDATGIGGVKQVSGINFLNDNGEWVATVGDIKYTLLFGMHNKVHVTDLRNGYSFGFRTVTMAKVFAKRRRHFRTYDEHRRAEDLLSIRDGFGLSMSALAKVAGVSPRTLEAYFSGKRVVPDGKVAVVAKALGLDLE